MASDRVVRVKSGARSPTLHPTGGSEVTSPVGVSALVAVGIAVVVGVDSIPLGRVGDTSLADTGVTVLIGVGETPPSDVGVAEPLTNVGVGEMVGGVGVRDVTGIGVTEAAGISPSPPPGAQAANAKMRSTPSSQRLPMDNHRVPAEQAPAVLPLIKRSTS